MIMLHGDRLWRMPECYIHGNTIKYLCVPDEVEFEVAADTNEFKMMMVDSATFQGIFTLM